VGAAIVLKSPWKGQGSCNSPVLALPLFKTLGLHYNLEWTIPLRNIMIITLVRRNVAAFCDQFDLIIFDTTIMSMLM
jgi:hypothetical protein